MRCTAQAWHETVYCDGWLTNTRHSASHLPHNDWDGDEDDDDVGVEEYDEDDVNDDDGDEDDVGVEEYDDDDVNDDDVWFFTFL